MLDFPSFSLRTQIRTGMAAEDVVMHELTALGAKRVLLVSDPGVVKSGIVEPIVAAIEKTTSLVKIFSDVMQDPTLNLMNQIGNICAAENVDVIVAVGGGAALDAAKGAAIVARTGESINAAIGEDKVFIDPLPVLAVPTTAGTGSEVSWHISVNDTENQRKVTVRSPRAVCHTAILDPKMISTVPPMVAAAAGMDALTHNLEAYVGNVGRWDLTDALTLHACKMIGRSMLPHWKDPSDFNAAEQMLIASCLGGVALSHSRTGIVHQMARPLGALFHVPHGLANAVLLPWCVEFAYHSDVDRYATVAAAIGADCDGLSPEAAAAAGVARIREMNHEMGIPKSLRDFGVTLDQVERMAKDALQGKSAVTNPCIATLEDVMSIYIQAIEASDE